MAGHISIARLQNAASRIANVWSANPDFTMGSVTKDELATAMARLQAVNEAVEGKRTELTGLMDNRDDQARELAELISRARSGIRAAFGPDSAQYEQAGGTRKSERKPRRRTTSQTTAV